MRGAEFSRLGQMEKGGETVLDTTVSVCLRVGEDLGGVGETVEGKGF